MKYELYDHGINIVFDAPQPKIRDEIAEGVSTSIGDDGKIGAIFITYPARARWVSAFGDAGKSVVASPSYDPEIDVVTFDFGPAKYFESEESTIAGIIVDYDVGGTVSGLEIFDARDRISSQELEAMLRRSESAVQMPPHRAVEQEAKLRTNEFGEPGPWPRKNSASTATSARAIA